jgi:precorrin isomerase
MDNSLQMKILEKLVQHTGQVKAKRLVYFSKEIDKTWQ